MIDSKPIPIVTLDKNFGSSFHTCMLTIVAMCHTILSHTLFFTLPRFGPFSCMRVFTLALWSYYCLVYRIAENFQGRKLSQILRFCGYSQKFLLQNLGAWCPLARQKRGIHESFLHENWGFFSPIHESFLPRKFPAIQYSCRYILTT